VRNGPRPLDLDIIFYGAQEVRSEALQVPHPRVQERPFVVAPLLDLLGRGPGEEEHWGRHSVFGGDIRRYAAPPLPSLAPLLLCPLLLCSCWALTAISDRPCFSDPP